MLTKAVQNYLNVKQLLNVRINIISYHSNCVITVFDVAQMKPNIKFQTHRAWLTPATGWMRPQNQYQIIFKLKTTEAHDWELHIKNMIWVSWINYKSIMTYLMPNILEGDASSCVIQSPAWGTLRSEGLIGSMFIWVSNWRDWRIIQSLTKKMRQQSKYQKKRRTWNQCRRKVSSGQDPSTQLFFKSSRL